MCSHAFRSGKENRLDRGWHWPKACSVRHAARPCGEFVRARRKPDVVAARNHEAKGAILGNGDGVPGPQTPAAIHQFQKSEVLPAMGRLDSDTSGKLGVGPEWIAGHLEATGREVGNLATNSAQASPWPLARSSARKSVVPARKLGQALSRQ